MAYKTATAGLDFGGGKAVILGDPDEVKTHELLREYGRVVDEFGGRFITGEDVSVDTDDLKTIEEETLYVGGREAVTDRGYCARRPPRDESLSGRDTGDGSSRMRRGRARPVSLH